jgi:hypothetical protein
MDNKNQPAFPVMMQQVGDNEYRAAKPSDPKEFNRPMAGMSKREYTAIMIMQGICANSNPGSYKQNAEDAVYATDLLLAELKK